MKAYSQLINERLWWWNFRQHSESPGEISTAKCTIHVTDHKQVWLGYQ